MAARQQTKVWLALWTVYIVWGSTYLGIRVAVHPSHGAGLPPLLLAGVRFAFAGLLVLAIAVRRPAADGLPDPLGPRQWLASAIVGTALVLGGNGLVSIAEKHVASGTAAVVVATVPIWSAVLGMLVGLERVSLRHGLGLFLGFVGVAALVGGTGKGHTAASGVLTLVAASLSWAAGSVWSRRAPLPRRPLVMTGMQMLSGGLASTVVALSIGEPGQLHLGDVSGQAWLAIAYLVTFGSVFAYTAYVWLLANAPLSRATSYAYVNPLVAVLLGVVLLHETFGARSAMATAAIVVGVALIVVPSRRARSAVAAATVPEPVGPVGPVQPEVSGRSVGDEVGCR
jgi:drug/metabolite transporter (DMT)-like permease